MNEKSQKTPKKIIKTQKDIEKLIVLMKKHKVDEIEAEGYRITISKHEFPDVGATKSKSEIDEELEFWNMGPQ